MQVVILKLLTMDYTSSPSLRPIFGAYSFQGELHNIPNSIKSRNVLPVRIDRTHQTSSYLWENGDMVNYDMMFSSINKTIAIIDNLSKSKRRNRRCCFVTNYTFRNGSV